MARVRAPLFSLQAQGSVDRSLTFRGKPRHATASSITSHPDAHTLSQHYQRSRYRDALFYWQSLTPAQQAAYSAQAVSRNLTGMNICLRAYLNDPLDQVLWLRCDQLPGGQITDFSKKGNHATNSGATLVDALLFHALSFNGSTDYAQISASPTLNFGLNDFTVMFWLQSPTSNPNNKLITKWQDNDNRWYIGIVSAGRVNFYAVGSSIVLASIESIAGVMDNLPHHIALVIEKGTDSKFYIDGSLDNSGNASSGDYDNTADIFIARRELVDYYEGYLDEVRFYNRALSPQQIANIATGQPWPPP